MLLDYSLVLPIIFLERLVNWRGASNILCDFWISTRWREDFYRMSLWPMIVCRIRMLGNTEQCIHKMSVAEMTVLKWICANTRRHEIRNENVHEMVVLPW